MVNLTPYDPADYLNSPEERALFLEACVIESGGDPKFIAKGLGAIARSVGMSEVAERTGLSRESLYKGLSGDRVPSLDTFLKVLAATGIQLSAVPLGADAPATATET